MSPQTLTCPYCNASLGVQADWSAGQRIVCPRCGDSFPLRFGDSFTAQQPVSHPTETGITTSAPTSDAAAPPRWSNRLIAGVLLGLMLLMAVGSLIFMLMTQEQRRSYDTSRPPRRPGKQRSEPEAENVPIVANIAPDKLAALGYLPSNINFLLAVRFAELVGSPLSAQLLHDPIKLGDAQFRLENLPEWLGFRLEEIDHVVFAARVGEAMPPPFYVVFRMAQPYEEEKLRHRLKGKRVPNASMKAIYSFRIPQQDIQLHAWFADERTVALALFADQLNSLPSQPVEDLQQFSQELRTVLKERREPVSPLWIAGHSRDWSKTWAALFLNRMKKEDAGKFASLRTFGIWLVPDDSLVVKGVFACKDESGARGLEDYFRSLHGPDTSFKTVLDGPWLTLQFQTSPDFLARVLKR